MDAKKRIFFHLLYFIFIFFEHNLFAQSTSPLTLSEIMFTPAETSGEFVEIFNTSTTQSIDLTGYKFKYYTSSNNNLVAISGGTILGPRKYAVIIQGSYDFNNGIYKTLVPDGTVILKTSGNNFGSSGMSNTTSRTVNLIDPYGVTVDIYTYSANNTAGYSDEKIELSKDNTDSNWDNSKVLNGTPGFRNSVSPVNYDLTVTFLLPVPGTPIAEDSVTITSVIKNIGKQSAQNFSIDIYYDVNLDSIGQTDENIFSNMYVNLSINDSIIVERKIYIDSAGSYSIIANITYPDDENTSNNIVVLKFNALEKPAEPTEIILNEIMYAPTDDEPEWIEIYNCSDRPLNLKDYKIGDNTSMVVVSAESLILNPGEYLVISDDVSISNYHLIPSRVVVKSLPSLSNNGDDIILRNNVNAAVDSLRYLPEWGGTGGKSLERISFDNSSLETANWKSSFSNYDATPGRINSVSPKDYDLSVESFTANVLYVEMGESINVNVSIENSGKLTAENFLIKLYKDQNMNSTGDPTELIEESLQAKLETGSTLNMNFSVSGFIIGKNRFIVSIDYAADQYTDNNSMLLDFNAVKINERKGDLVINEIMYAPASPEPEYVRCHFAISP